MLSLTQLQQTLEANSVYYLHGRLSSGYVVNTDKGWYFVNRFMLETEGRIETTFPANIDGELKEGWK